MVTLAICGPKYNTKVCRPVPKPIELAMPRPIHQDANTTISSANDLYYSHYKAKFLKGVIDYSWDYFSLDEQSKLSTYFNVWTRSI